MRKFVLLVTIIALLISMGTAVRAAPPPEGPSGLKRAVTVQEEHSRKLLDIPSIVGTGVGITSEGIATVKIFTERKGVTELPKTLDGVPVEVIVTGKFYAYTKNYHTNTVTVGQAPLPDLTLSSSSADITFDPASPVAGDTVTITATIHNVGGAEATNVVVSFYDGRLDLGGTQIATDQMIPSVVAGGGTDIASVDWTAVSGNHDIFVYVDRDNAIAESDESNNMAYNRITVGLARLARLERPVPIGISTGHPSITAGTIGARVKDTDGPHVYALSNNHVYALQNDAAIGDSALQPGPIDGGTYPDDEIGTLWDFEPIEFFSPFSPPKNIPENTMDAAIALSSTDLLGNVTLPDGYGIPGVMPVEATIDLPVQKYGRTTGLTHGTVSAINVTVDVCYEAIGTFCLKQARFVNQLMITPGSFSDGGDSGSLIVTDDDNKNPVGLLFAGSTTFTVANPIIPVLQRFNVSVDSGLNTNDPPVANDDSATTNEETAVVIDVTANDTDVDGTIDKTTVNITVGPSNGSTSVDPVTGMVTYTPNTDFNGTDNFKYTVNDNLGAASNVANVSVSVTGTNDPPVANDDSATVDEGGTISIDVLNNDTDPDSTLDYSNVTITATPSNGSAAVDVSGISYTHDGSETITDSFTYQVCDGGTPNLCDTATVAITIEPASPTMHVGSINMGIARRIWKWARVEASVLIRDSSGTPVQGATVIGDWGGAYNANGVSAITEDNGIAIFRSKWGSGTFTFTVTDVSKSGFEYDSALNKETSDSIVAP